jgi:hypothetical protein
MRERAFFNAVGGERELLCRWLLEERETTRQWSEREGGQNPCVGGVRERISDTSGRSEREGDRRRESERAREGKGLWVFSEENEAAIFNLIFIF